MIIVLYEVITLTNEFWNLWVRTRRQEKTSPLKVQKIQKVLEQQPGKNNTLIFGGVLLAMSSIGLLIFVLSDKVFHLSWLIAFINNYSFVENL